MVRRAHQYCESLVQKGCSLRPGGYPASLVALERKRPCRMRDFDADMLLELVMSLCRALAGTGNAYCANAWLRYLSECGLEPRHARELWESVRAAHPHDIFPSVHSFDTSAGGLSVPSWTRPVALSGERIPTVAGSAWLPKQEPGLMTVTCRPGENSSRPHTVGSVSTCPPTTSMCWSPNSNKPDALADIEARSPSQLSGGLSARGGASGPSWLSVCRGAGTCSSPASARCGRSRPITR